VKKVVSKEEKQIVLARLQTMPPGLRMSIGSEGTFDKWQLIDAVEKETELGEFIVSVYMDNLRDFKK
jgi:hypothetical protein